MNSHLYMSPAERFTVLDLCGFGSPARLMSERERERERGRERGRERVREMERESEKESKRVRECERRESVDES